MRVFLIAVLSLFAVEARAAWNVVSVMEIEALSFGVEAEVERAPDVEAPLGEAVITSVSLPVSGVDLATELAIEPDGATALGLVAARDFSDRLGWYAELAGPTDGSEVSLTIGLSLSL